MRWGVVATLIIVSTVGLSQANDAKAAPTQFVNIPSQPLGVALAELARTRDLQIIYHSEIVGARRTAGAVGEFTPEQELKQLLNGTGLTYRYLNNTTVTIVPIASTSPPSSPSAAAEGSKSRANQDRKEGKTSSSRNFRLAQAATASDQDRFTLEHPTAQFSEQPANLQEIVVTAERRTENIQRVPMSITALAGPQLSARGEYEFQDYAGRVPGLTLIDDGALGSQLVIRGLTSGGTVVNSPVAVYIDETPYTAAGPWAGSYLIAPNLDTFDMTRIEVLRGPQGTLYGAQALGGLLKYVTNPPDPAKFAASAQAVGDSVYNGATGFEVHGMLNVPLSSKAAIRFVGYDRDSPGYIDDPSRDLTGINGSHYSGGRVSVLYLPTTSLSLRLSGLYQRHRGAIMGMKTSIPARWRRFTGR